MSRKSCPRENQKTGVSRRLALKTPVRVNERLGDVPQTNFGDTLPLPRSMGKDDLRLLSTRTTLLKSNLPGRRGLYKDRGVRRTNSIVAFCGLGDVVFQTVVQHAEHGTLHHRDLISI